MAKTISKKAPAAESSLAPPNGKKARKRAADMFDEPPEVADIPVPSKKAKISKSKDEAPRKSKRDASNKVSKDSENANAGEEALHKSTKTKDKLSKKKSRSDDNLQPSQLDKELDKKALAAEEPSLKEKKSKKSKEGEAEEVPPRKRKGKSEKDAPKELKKPRLDKALVVEPEESEGFESDVESQGDEQALEEHEADLLAGFDDSEEENAEDVGFSPNKPVPKIDKSKELSKRLKKATKNGAGEPGVIYVGRIPHGFHEHEMRSYFSQFGTVQHVRLSRSKKTGNSKHYAFLQFESAEVANIVAETMNNYLLFGHILKCHVIPNDQVHEKMWVGADKRFKTVPWNKIEGRKLELAKGRSEWERKVANTAKAREAKIEKLRKLGYNFDAPELKSVNTVPTLQAPEEESKISIIEADNGTTVTVKEEIKKKTKKRKKQTADEIGTGDHVVDTADKNATVEQYQMPESEKTLKGNQEKVSKKKEGKAKKRS